MMDAESHAADDETPLGLHPSLGVRVWQFGVVDLLAAMLMLTLFLALFNPLLNLSPQWSWICLTAVIVVDMLIVFLIAPYHCTKRSAALAQAGTLVGRGTTGECNWQLWPAIKGWSIAFFLLTIVSLGLYLLTMLFIERHVVQVFFTFALVLPYVQFSVTLPLQLSRWFCRFSWRAFPGTVEIFEYGIILQGVQFLNWDRVSVRPCKIYPARIDLLTDLSAGNGEGKCKQLMVVRLDAYLRDRLLSQSHRQRTN